jgi:hypothetical protein
VNLSETSDQKKLLIVKFGIVKIYLYLMAPSIVHIKSLKLRRANMSEQNIENELDLETYLNPEKERHQRRLMRSKSARSQRKEKKQIRQIKLDKEERELYDEFDSMMEKWGFSI